MAENSVQELVDSLCGAGLVAVGREHIPGLIAGKDGDPKDQLLMLIAQGRSLGVYFYLDQSINPLDAMVELAHKLGVLGFSMPQAFQVLVNIAPKTYAELKNFYVGNQIACSNIQ